MLESPIGPLIVRDDDVIGQTVNLAARIDDVTPDGRLYVPLTLASALPADRSSIGRRAASRSWGFGRIELVDLARPGGARPAS